MGDSVIKPKPKLILKICTVKEPQPLETGISCIKTVEVQRESVDIHKCTKKSEW